MTDIKITDPNNQCKICGRKVGKYRSIKDNSVIGVFLYNSHDGGKVCNLDVMTHRGIPKRKMNKKEKKMIQKMMLQSKKTLDNLKAV